MSRVQGGRSAKATTSSRRRCSSPRLLRWQA